MTNPLSGSKDSGNDTSCPDKPDYQEDSSTGNHDSSQITVDNKDTSVGGSLKTVLNEDYQQDETSETKSSQDTSLKSNDFEPSNPKPDITKNGHAEDDIEKHVKNNLETCDTNVTKIEKEKPPISPATKVDETVSITSEKPSNSPATKIDETVRITSEKPNSPATKVDETVSITSESSSEEDEDDISLDKKSRNCNNEVIVLDNDSKHEAPNGVSQNCDSLEVHEIESDNDDCIVTNDDDINGEKEKPVLRRSSRAIKQKKYVNDDEDDDEDEPEEFDESDVEEVEISDPLCHKPEPVRINHVIAVREMAKKKAKHSNSNQCTIDSEKKYASDGKSTSDSQSLYQSILARGTTVTPISSKVSAPVKNVSESAQTAILPSLTDDMFVVEAPSFIVPYVYEKPSMKPFREFVDKLGKQLAEEKAKLEKEQSEKEKLEKELKDKLRQEKKERGEEVSESEDVAKKAEAAADEEKKRKKAQKREKRKRKNDDDASWDGSSSTDSDDETLSDDDTIVIKDKDDDIQDITGLTADKLCNGKSDNYFDCSLGKFFVNIGLSLVQEYVQTDLLKRQKRILTKEKKSGYDTKETQIAIASLMKNIEFSKENNAPYSFQQQKCEFCSFKTESKLILDNHLQTPHMRNNNYKCNFCEFEVRNPHDILLHLEQKHQVKGKLERALGCHQCNNCPFEDNGKGKLARHQVACAKKFRPETNLAPPVEWEPPAKIPKIVKARNNVGAFQNAFTRHLGNSTIRSPMNKGGILGISGVSTATSRSLSASLTPSRTQPPVFGLPIMRANSKARGNTSTPISINSSINNSKPKTNNSLSISITPLPRQTPPSTQSSAYSKSFVICEICDGYITDLEQLRNHMQWIHKVRIPPKMIYNRPPLNCQKCQFRFFTDQGLERHLLGSHGLVTSSMQEAANKGKDAGRCPVCGRVFQWKLLSHVAKDHNLTLKPAHLSYKCTVCTATFSMYKQFEDHVYSAHSVVAKRVMDKSKTTATTAKQLNNSTTKQMKISDEITITPQPVKTAASAKPK